MKCGNTGGCFGCRGALRTPGGRRGSDREGGAGERVSADKSNRVLSCTLCPPFAHEEPPSSSPPLGFCTSTLKRCEDHWRYRNVVHSVKILHRVDARKELGLFLRKMGGAKINMCCTWRIALAATVIYRLRRSNTCRRDSLIFCHKRTERKQLTAASLR